MRYIMILVSMFVLSGCAKQPVSENIAETAQNSLVVLENSLGNTCNTPEIKTQINAIKMQINTISQVCELEKAEIRADKIKWQTAFFGLLLAIAVFIITKIRM